MAFIDARSSGSGGTPSRRGVRPRVYWIRPDVAGICTILGFGADVVAPTPIRITVKGGEIFLDSQDTPIDPGLGDTLGVTAFDVSATLTGAVTRQGDGVQTRVVAINPASGGVVARADTDSDGNYSLPLADGSYDIAVQVESLPPGVVPPTPVRVAVEVAADPSTPIKEEQGTADDGVVSFALASASVTLTGIVQDDSGNFLKDVRVRARKGTKTVGRAVTNSAGAYSLQLPTGTVDVSVNPDSIPAGFLTPDPSRVEVSVNNGTAAITTSAGDITSLNLVVTARSPNVTGTITFDFNGDSSIAGTEVVGCSVIVGIPDSDEIVSEVPSSPADGGYSLTLPNGTYIIGVNPETLPPGSAPPPIQRVSVTNSGVTLADGTSSASATIDFELVRRAATLTGVVQLSGRGVAVGLKLIDLATDTLVSRVGSTPVSGAYRMPVFPGTYELRVDADTLPAGTAVPAPVVLSVDSAGVISTTTATITTLAITLTRNVATLTGEVTVIRNAASFPVEVVVQALDPQDYSPLAETVSDPDTGAYSLKLAAGSYAIGIAPDSLPPGVLPPAALVVSSNGTNVTGTAVSSNTLDLALEDTRAAGADITGTVFESGTTNGLICELRVFDPINGSVNQNFILSVPTDANGDFAFRAPVGTYRLGVVPDSLSPTAVPPTGVNFSVQGTSVVESNTTFVSNQSENAANDGVIKFSIQDGASSGITVTGTVTDPGSNPIPGVRVIIEDTTTGEIVKEAITTNSGSYTAVLPLGSYRIKLDPNSMPFNAIPPAPKAVLAANTGSIVVTTNNGATVSVNGGGTYDFDFQTTAASQSLSGTILDSNGDPARVFVAIIDPSDDSFVTGRFSEVADGSYVIQLAPGGYEVQLDPQTLPPGNTSPAPVAISVNSSSIVETQGTDNDGTVDFTLLSASATISGTVLDTNGDPVACFAGALDALTDEFVTGVPTNPSTGAYSLTLPPGTYKVGVDPQSLPAGVVPPALTVVDVSSTDQTFNMTLQLATATVSGSVTGASTSQPLPCFLILRDASTELIVAESPTAPDGSYSLSAAAGFYELIVESNSLPPGTIAPTPVPVQFTSSGVLESNTVGGSNVANDGTVNFSITEASGGGLATLTGNVTLTIGGNSSPVGAFVFVRNANTGDFIAGGPADPGERRRLHAADSRRNLRSAARSEHASTGCGVARRNPDQRQLRDDRSDRGRVAGDVEHVELRLDPGVQRDLRYGDAQQQWLSMSGARHQQ